MPLNETITMYVGELESLPAIGVTDNLGHRVVDPYAAGVTFQSNDPAVATVSYGSDNVLKITGVSAAQCLVNAYYNGTALNGTLTVNVANPIPTNVDWGNGQPETTT